MSAQKPKERGPGEEHRPRLGRGLAALLADTTQPASGQADPRDHRVVAVEFLRPNPRNPRRQFDDRELGDLADSIRAKGVIQPILVRAIRNVAGSFEIIAGERRWRAAQAAELTEVPVIVIEADDREALAVAIIENVQRADLNAIEEARGYERLGQEFDYSHNDLSALIGKSRSHVANTLRLLKLPGDIIDMVARADISAGHARALLGFADPEPVARRILGEGLTVRDVEALAQQAGEGTAGDRPRTARQRKSAESKALAGEFSRALGLSVTHNAKGDAGEIRIRYATAAELKDLRDRLAGGPG